MLARGSKYADFWDAKMVLQKLLCQNLDWSSVREVRDRTILILRLFHLCRSVDLQRSRRRKALMQGATWLWLQRKGQARGHFEKLLQLPCAALSPAHLLDAYVKLTAERGPQGGPLFVSLHPLSRVYLPTALLVFQKIYFRA